MWLYFIPAAILVTFPTIASSDSWAEIWDFGNVFFTDEPKV